MNDSVLIILIVVSGAIYMSPGVVAVSRNTKKSNAILVLNLLLGWTFLGWVLALVWAVADEPVDEA